MSGKAKKMTKAQAAAARWNDPAAKAKEEERREQEARERRAYRSRSIRFAVIGVGLIIIGLAIMYAQGAFSGCSPIMSR